MAMTIVCKRDGCPRRGMAMKPVDEFTEHVLYVCPFDGAGLKPRGCGAARLITKDICGGTRGAGKQGNLEQTLRGTERR